jgi:hypothetical protein
LIGGKWRLVDISILKGKWEWPEEKTRYDWAQANDYNGKGIDVTKKYNDGLMDDVVTRLRNIMKFEPTGQYYFNSTYASRFPTSR